MRTNPVQYDDMVGPRYVNLDMSLAKQFHITERARFELRVEGSNMDNHLTLAAPVTSITNVNFGRLLRNRRASMAARCSSAAGSCSEARMWAAWQGRPQVQYSLCLRAR